MQKLTLFVSIGLLAACGEGASTPAAVTAVTGAATSSSGAAVNAVESGSALPVSATTAAPETSASSAPAPEKVAGLPLKRGFYVASDTPCGKASNATLLLVRRDGINGSRDTCTFEKIEKIGATTYRVTDSCSSGGEAWGSEEQVERISSTYEIPNDTSYKAKSDSGWEHSARYCAQSALPEPWRDNDIRDLIK